MKADIGQALLVATELTRHLQTLNREQRRISENAVANSQFEKCKQLRRKIMRYVSGSPSCITNVDVADLPQIYLVESEEWLHHLLQANDELVTALITFEQLDRSIDADSDSDDEVAEQAHRYRSTSLARSLFLLLGTQANFLKWQPKRRRERSLHLPAVLVFLSPPWPLCASVPVRRLSRPGPQRLPGRQQCPSHHSWRKPDREHHLIWMTKIPKRRMKTIRLLTETQSSTLSKTNGRYHLIGMTKIPKRRIKITGTPSSPVSRVDRRCYLTTKTTIAKFLSAYW